MSENAENMVDVEVQVQVPEGAETANVDNPGDAKTTHEEDDDPESHAGDEVDDSEENN